MKRRVTLILAVAFVTMFFTQRVFASPIVYIVENGNHFYKSGTMWDITSTGRSGHAYQYLVQNTAGVYGQWTLSVSGSPTYYWVWIPRNGGSLDATVKYRVASVYLDPSFFLTVNQEYYADRWVYLGFTDQQGSYVKLPNKCAASYCDPNMQVWWDDVMYQYP